MIDTEFIKFVGDFVNKAGVAGLLIVAVVCFMKGWLVPGWIFEMIRKERDDAIAITHRSQDNAETAVNVIEAHVTKTT